MCYAHQSSLLNINTDLNSWKETMGSSVSPSTRDLTAAEQTSIQYIDKDLEIRSYLYAAFGVIVCVSSTTCILVFSARELRGRYIMFLALSFGDLAPPKEEERRQRMILTITGISVLLVSIPCLFMVIDEWGVPRINELITGVAYCLYGVHSSLSLIVYTVFRPDFRTQLLLLVGFHKSTNTEVEKNSSQRGAYKQQGANNIHVLSKSQSSSKIQR
ncbi:hypothetical protein ANCDUO_02361 [Ancylostoma duodenale]|uniref:G-protein coupled receptors family 1 profile domain-containing protein n=1 Tax=Ancylostoma duodenale TaxID=51022 RepID=A0A0C2DBU9_9BILA|nr:hypothetical protein ANCDUO_02361 [Ancylostoma duodenale]